MMPATYPLSRAQALVVDIVATNDPVRLGECLRGMHLPAMGGGDHPGEVVARVVGLPTTKPELAFDLAKLLGSLLGSAIDRLEIDNESIAAATEIREDTLSSHDEVLLFNGLMLACSLPADPGLAGATRKLGPFLELRGLTGVEPRRLNGLLRYAQIYQQVDDTLEDYWLQLMATSGAGEEPLTSDQRTVLMDSWRGLLWIPPSPEAKASGEVVSFERVEKGLLRLHEITATREEPAYIVTRALKVLTGAFPRSPEFWHRKLAPRIAEWPVALQQAVVARWPRLEEVLAGGAPFRLKPELLEIWRALEPEVQHELVETAEGQDVGAWKSLWVNLLFSEPAGSILPHDWRQGINELELAFEQHFGISKPSRKALSQRPRKRGKSKNQRQKGRRRTRSKIDRKAAKEHANKFVGEIESRLEQGDLRTAERFLDEFVDRQEREGTEPEHIAKTLSSVAAKAAKYRYFEWATDLYRRAKAC